MVGLTNYIADDVLTKLTGQYTLAMPASMWLALFTAVGTDVGSGFTEVSGGSYVRVQVAGTIAAAASWTTSTAVITMGVSNPGWVVAGMTVYDSTNGKTIGTVSTYSGTTLTLTANAANASQGSTDNLVFSAFGAPSGTAPSSISNGALIQFAQASANWGTVIAFGLYDASTSGNLWAWDFMGNYSWLPASVSDASPAVFTTHAHGFANGDPIVVTAEYDGTLPTVSAGGPLTSYTVNYALSVATDTFELNTQSGGGGTTLNTSTSGDVMVRKITQQSIPQNVSASFAAGTFTITAS